MSTRRWITLMKVERDEAVARANQTDTTTELRALRAVALATERRLCGVGSADEERRALAAWRLTL